MLDIRKEKIVKEQQQIIGIVPVVNMKNFVMLLLVDLASKSKYHLDGSKTKTACLSSDYKRIIEDIMYQENGWGIKFAELIDIYSYYEFQAKWEEKLGKTISKVLKELNKKINYDYERDVIEIEFTEDEIDNIKNMYDEKTLKIMDRFSNLMNDITFRREFKLGMKDLERNQARANYNLEELRKRVEYANKMKLAKSIVNTEDKSVVEKNNQSLIKKIIKKLSKSRN